MLVDVTRIPVSTAGSVNKTQTISTASANIPDMQVISN